MVISVSGERFSVFGRVALYVLSEIHLRALRNHCKLALMKREQTLRLLELKHMHLPLNVICIEAKPPFTLSVGSPQYANH